MITWPALICCFLFGFIFYRRSRSNDKFPPGPRGVPFLGSLPFISYWHKSKRAYEGLTELHTQYGPVIGFCIGPQPVVSFGGSQACKEALQIESLNGRPDSAPARMKSRGKRMGLMLVDGEFWSIQRRFTLRCLRELGLSGAENLLATEISSLLSRLLRSDHQSGNKLHGKVIEFNHTFNVPLINVVWSLIGGKSMEHDDPRLAGLIELIDLIGRSGDVVRAAFPCPAFLLKLCPSLFAKLGRMDLMEPVLAFIQEAIDDHKANGPYDKKDFISLYLEELEGNPHSSFSEEQLVNIVLDLFAAGSDTTSNSIGFALLYLIHHQEVQRKMQEELDRVCGPSLPALSHRSQLVYTQAVLMEVQRLANIAPLAIPRRALKETPFRDYIIPQDAFIIINLHSIHMEEAYWKDPEIFRPERHISPDGRIIVPSTDHLLPFGSGKRSCLGESLARSSYYLFTTALVKTFTLSGIPADDGSIMLPSLEPMEGFTLAHRPFRALLTERLC